VAVYDILTQSKFCHEECGEAYLCKRLQFKVTNFFSFGSPLGMILANRLLQQGKSAGESLLVSVFNMDSPAYLQLVALQYWPC
jgi:hypothetical protein